MKKFLLGILISSVFIYFSIQYIDFSKILLGLKNARYVFLYPTVILIMCIPLLRSLRFGILLSPIEKISQKRLFPITCIGFMAIALFPMRLGELVRPYLVSTKNQIPFSSAIASIFIERALDLLILLFMLALVTINSNLPSWVVKAGYSFLLIFLFLLGSILVFYFKTETAISFLSPFLNKLPQRFRMKIETLFKAFLVGFKIVGDKKKIMYTVCLTVLIWGLLGIATYTLFLFYNIRVPLLGAFVVLLITIIGISLPTAPGFLGNFQFSCIFALSLFHVQKTEAFSFSLIYYFLVVVNNILLGLFFLPFEKFSFVNIKNYSAKIFNKS